MSRDLWMPTDMSIILLGWRYSWLSTHPCSQQHGCTTTRMLMICSQGLPTNMSQPEVFQLPWNIQILTPKTNGWNLQITPLNRKKNIYLPNLLLTFRFPAVRCNYRGCQQKTYKKNHGKGLGVIFWMAWWFDSEKSNHPWVDGMLNFKICTFWFEMQTKHVGEDMKSSINPQYICLKESQCLNNNSSVNVWEDMKGTL